VVVDPTENIINAETVRTFNVLSVTGAGDSVWGGRRIGEISRPLAVDVHLSNPASFSVIPNEMEWMAVYGGNIGAILPYL